MKKIKTMCKPAGPGLAIPIPGKVGPTGLPELMSKDGMAVDLSETYWKRRLRGGDIVRVATQSPKAIKSEKSSGKDNG